MMVWLYISLIGRRGIINYYLKLYKSNIIVENSVLKDIITKLDNDSNTCFIHLGISQPPSFFKTKQNILSKLILFG